MKILLFFSSLVLFVFCNQRELSLHYSKVWSESDRSFLTTNLKSSFDSILNEIEGVSEEDWTFRSSSDKWSLAEIVEHLIVHDELFYREARVLAGLESMSPQSEVLFADDNIISSYREITVRNSGKAPAYLEPLGRWCSKAETISGYSRIRDFLINFVKDTDKDLRKYYTSSGRGPTTYRDLHQLLLISVAHTERHLKQIQNLKRDIKSKR